MTHYVYMKSSTFDYSRFRFNNYDLLNYALFCLFDNSEGTKFKEITKETYDFMAKGEEPHERQMRLNGKKVGTFTELAGIPTTCNDEWL